jgi:hypothetical protein
VAWSIVPPGGWHFHEEGRAENDPIRGDTHDDLVARLRNDRAQNHRPIGDPEAEVDSYICGKWPHVCGARPLSGPPPKQGDDDEAPKQEYGRPVVKKLSERVGSWLATRYARINSLDCVAAPEAERRAGICSRCSANVVDWRSRTIRDCPGCAVQIENLDALAYKIRKGKDVMQAKRLGACNQFGHDNNTAVWMGENGLKHAKHWQAGCPSPCWLKEIQKGC